MTQLTQLNRVSIAEVVVYTPYFLIGIYLSIRHGFRRSSGWFYLIMFSLARLLGAALQLATINSPDNMNLYIGAMTLEAIGLSPLILIGLGLLSRVLQSATRVRGADSLLLQPKMFRLVQLVLLAGLILGIVGGSQIGDEVGSDPSVTTSAQGYQIPTTSQAGTGCMIAGYGLLVLFAALMSVHVRHAEPGEKRLLLAIVLALPFVGVRMVYAALVTFDSQNPEFRQYGGSGDHRYMIGMSVVMEMVAVLIYEVFGLLTQQRPKHDVQQQELPARGMNKLESGEYQRQGQRSEGYSRPGAF